MKTALSLFCIAFSVVINAQNAQPAAAGSPFDSGAAKAADPLKVEAFARPPKDIEAIVAAPRHLNFTLGNLSPDGKWFCITNSGGMPRLEHISKPYVTLAGEKFDVRANRDRDRSVQINTGFTLISPRGDQRVKISAPAGTTVSGPTWSTSGRWLAFMAHADDASYIYVADPMDGSTRRVTDRKLLATLTSNLEWAADDKTLFAVLIPQNRMAMPQPPAVAAQPRVQVGEAGRSRARPVRGLMETKYDQDLLEYLTTGQLASIDVTTGAITEIGKPAMIRSFSPAPDRTAVRVTTMQKPFSYLVYMSSFGSKEELWLPDGKVAHEFSNRRLQLPTGAPPTPNPNPNPTAPGGGRFGGGQGGRGGAAAQGGGTPSGEPRQYAWHPSGVGMVFLQLEPAPARAEGQPAPQNPPRRKDRIMQWLAPYGKENVKEIYSQENPISSATFSADGRWIFVNQTRDGRSETIAIDTKNGNKSTVISPPAGTPDPLNPTGSLMSKTGPAGVSVTRVSSDDDVYYSGTQSYQDPTKDAPRPFVDKVSLTDGKRTRIWQSAADIYETMGAMIDDDMKQVILNRQSPTMINDSYHFDTASKSLTNVSKNTDYARDVTKAQRFRVQITRPDGFKFWADVTMPHWWVKGVKLPAMFWFYPGEFTDQASYDQSKRSLNKNLFPTTGTRSMEILTTLGYAVIEPDCPIVGPAERKNDTYIPDLRNNLAATIDELEKRGFIDRSRLALGGHSYGAFSTANAMIHTPFFKAGIAGDGAYNRMLTPMQFQSETRLLWEARETYLNMSPLLYAEQMTGAFLMYHGIDDMNAGTHPINSERMFNALDGLGKDVALYMYPYEDHNPISIDTILDMWARWVPWLDKYVMKAGRP